MNTADYFAVPQFQVGSREKQQRLLGGLNWLTQYHYQRSEAYKRLLDRARGGALHPAATVDEVPYVPVSLFKTHRLQSVPDAAIRNMLTSSGTSGQGVSRIAVDAETADLQNRALAAIVKTIVGNERLPMLLADTNAVIRNPALMTARGAGIVGFIRFGRRHTFILDEDMEIREDRLHDFLGRHGGRPFMIFGFTFMVWQYLYEMVRKGSFDLSNGILMHSGGWKKLESISVDNATFRQRFADSCGLTRIYNFYGMVEQLGSIFVEGEGGRLYPPDFAEVIIRNPATWQPAKDGESGIIQVLSLLPRSYPGHSLLTEDLGVLTTLTDSASGLSKRGLRVLGRLPRTELRGCSDTFALQISSEAA
jgi:Acyl-protein synthetase, LuxE